MREIKFRGWHKESKRMVEVGSINLRANDDFDYVLLKDHELRYEGIYGFKTGVEVELMQFTGLKDKNDKEIYEGDFLKDSLGQIMKIEWIFNGFKAVFKNSFGAWVNERDFVDIKFMEVIGNIYENPELLTDITGGQPNKTKSRHVSKEGKR